MGIISNRFANKTYDNEAAVEQNFIYPLLKEFLGFREENIVPKDRYNVMDAFPINREKEASIELLKRSGTPDFTIVDDFNQPLFVVESKGPNEDLSEFTHQYQAYCAAKRVNFILVTNGKQLIIYNVNYILIQCDNIEQIDRKFSYIEKLLHKNSQNIPPLQRMRQIDFEEGASSIIQLTLTDFQPYLERQVSFSDTITVLKEEFTSRIEYECYNFKSSEDTSITYQFLMEQIQNSPEKFFILKGDSGIGKTLFSKFLIRHFSNLALEGKCEFIPILLNLGTWRSNSDLIRWIYEKFNESHLNEGNINNSLHRGNFLIIFDAFDEVDYNLRVSFLKDFFHFKEIYPSNKMLFMMKTGITEQKLEKDAKIFFMEPPKYSDLSNYIKMNLDIEIDQFILELRSNNLIKIAEHPLFLNYIIIYKKKFGKFPNSKFTILNDLVQNYFEGHLGRKFVGVEVTHIQQILPLIAFEMVIELKTLKLEQQQFRSIIYRIISDLKESFAIPEEIDADIISDFLVTHNLITIENGLYYFWHHILLDYVCALAFAEKINSKNLIIPLAELFKWSNVNNTIILSFPLISNEEFKNELKYKNIFLYMDSILEKPKLKDEDINFISQILLKKVKSRFRLIREITWTIIQKFLKFLENPEQFLITIIDQTTRGEVVNWALLELGNLKTETAMKFLLTFNDFDYETDWLDKPIKGYLLLALSNFDDQEVQDKIMTAVEKEWEGIQYLYFITNAIKNVLYRGSLSQQSFERILKLFETPEEYEIYNKYHLNFQIREFLEDIIIQYNDSTIVPRLFAKVKEEDKFERYTIINVISKIIKPQQLEDFIQMLKSSSISVEHKGDISHILLSTNQQINFEDIIEILEHIQRVGFKMEFLNIDKIDAYREEHPEIIDYFLPFSNFVRILLNERNNVANINIPKISAFLEPYLDCSISVVQDTTIQFFGKYDYKKLRRNYKVFFQDSQITLLKIISQYDLPFAIERIKILIEKFIDEPDQFHNIFLFRDLIRILLDVNQIETAEMFLNKFLQTEIDYKSFNCFLLKFLSEFSKDFYFKTLNHFITQFLQLEENKFSQLKSLFRAVPLIIDEQYIEICLKLLKEFRNDSEAGYLIHDLFDNLIYVNPIDYESQIIELMSNGLENQHALWRGLNLLAFIGTDKSIKFLEQFLIDPSEEKFKQMAFFCIYNIKKRQNINWYNQEEINDN